MIIETYDTNTGQFVNVDLATAEYQPLAKLPEGLDSYFVPTSSTLEIPVSELIPTRARPKGVKTANQLMTDARAGKVEKRSPIEISREVVNGRRLVVDGNSTLLNALYSDWPTIYVVEV